MWYLIEVFHPENEGKVFLFRYGKKIYEKLMEVYNLNLKMKNLLTHLTFGKLINFKLKIRKVDGYWNYDKSEFDSSSKLKEDDPELDKIWKSEYSLKEFLDSRLILKLMMNSSQDLMMF